MKILLVTIPLALVFSFLVIMPLTFINSFLKRLPPGMRQEVLGNTNRWDRYTFWFHFMFRDQDKAVSVFYRKVNDA